MAGSGEWDIYDWTQYPEARYDLINSLISEHGYETYLEIGCRQDRCFNAVRSDIKVGVDPQSGGTIRMYSDDFFEALDQNELLDLSPSSFDIVFVDGDHRCEQVYRDVMNSLAHLNEGGVIVMHDCLPSAEAHQLRDYRGGICNQDAWKACVLLRTHSDIDVSVGLFDFGVGVVKARENPQPLQLDFALSEDNLADVLTWQHYVDNHVEWLRPQSYDALLAWVRGVRM